MEETTDLWHWRPKLSRIYFAVWIEDKHHHLHHAVFRQLLPGRKIHMDTSLYIGQTLTMALQGVDQYGNPFPLPAPDTGTQPNWTDTTPTVETLTPAANGLSCVAPAIAAGTDAVTAIAAFGGQTYTAILDVTVTKAPPVLAGMVIVPTVTGP